MKKIYYILLLPALFVACDLLDVEPESQWSEADIPTQESHIQGLLDGGYNLLSSALLQGFVIYGDQRADIYYVNDRTQTAYGLISRSQIDGNTSRASWGTFYQAIRQANLVLKYVDSFIENSDSGTQRNSLHYIKGQAYTMRAFAYFWIVRIWGEAPLVLNPAMEIEFIAKNSITDIFAQIHKDLDEAKTAFDNISESGSTRTAMNANRHRFGLMASYAVKAHCYMWQASYDDVKYYDDALTCLDLVISSPTPGYALASLYSDAAPEVPEEDSRTSDFRAFVDTTPFSQMFNSPTGKTGPESVFELAFSNADGDVNNAFDAFWTSANVTLFKARESLYHELFADPYRQEEGRAADTEGPPDFRRYAAIACPLSGGKIDARKWVVGYQRGDTRNLVLIRLADLLLLRAEARIKPLVSGNVSASDVPSILGDINRVRERAMGPQAKLIAANMSSWTKADWNQLVKTERNKELLFEGQRWFDLMRWGDAFYVLANMKRAERATYPFDTGPVVYDTPNPAALYWPVSNEEIRRSRDKITQNPYYK